MAFQNLPIERTKQHKLCNVPIPVQHSFVFNFVVVKLPLMHLPAGNEDLLFG
jgi:hypothetical protein